MASVSAVANDVLMLHSQACERASRAVACQAYNACYAIRCSGLPTLMMPSAPAERKCCCDGWMLKLVTGPLWASIFGLANRSPVSKSRMWTPPASPPNTTADPIGTRCLRVSWNLQKQQFLRYSLMRDIQPILRHDQNCEHRSTCGPHSSCNLFVQPPPSSTFEFVEPMLWVMSQEAEVNSACIKHILTKYDFRTGQRNTTMSRLPFERHSR